MVADGRPFRAANDTNGLDRQDREEEVPVGAVVPVLVHRDGRSKRYRAVRDKRRLGPKGRERYLVVSKLQDRMESQIENDGEDAEVARYRGAGGWRWKVIKEYLRSRQLRREIGRVGTRPQVTSRWNISA